MNSLKGEYVETVRYVWIIENFFLQFGSDGTCVGRKISSPYFPMEGTEDNIESWRVNIRASRKSNPNSSSDTGEDTYLIIHVWNRNSEYSMSSAFADYCKLEMVDKNQSCVYAVVVPKTVSWPDYSYNTFCNLGELERQNPDLKAHGALTIIVTIGIDPNPWLQTPKYKTSCATAVRMIDKKPLPKLVQSLKDMLDQEILTDVVVKTKDKDFNCHKVVLAASSEFFRGMFQCQMKESSENSVDLSELFDSSTMEAALNFMYTERISPCDENISNLSLYMAADYFQLAGLKNICSTQLSQSINVENAADILHLSNKYKEEFLNNCVVKFIGENLNKVMLTPGWSHIPGDVIKELLPLFLQYHRMD